MKITLGRKGALRERMDADHQGEIRAAKGRRGRWLGFLFFGVFLFGGLGFGCFMFGPPLIGVLEARDWPTTPCVIQSSQLEQRTDSDGGTTYKVLMTFTYDVAGRSYTSETYSFFSSISTSGAKGKRAIVQRYPPGSRAVCYVDPADPTRAVIDRSLSPTLWFALIPAAFVVIGVIGIAAIAMRAGGRIWATGSAKRAKPEAGEVEPWLPALAKRELERGQAPDRIASRHGDGDDGVAEPETSRWGKVGTMLLVAVFWNGIIGVLGYQVFAGGVPWFVGVFLIPFAVVGLVLCGAVVRAVMAVGNPTVRMRFDRRVVGAGETLELDWQIDGRAERIQRLRLWIEAIERASYTRGTDTVTDEHTIYHEILHDEASDPLDPMPREGSSRWEIPADTMHSFDAEHNEIVWRLMVEGEIAKWPDVKDEYALAVVPPGHAAAGTRRRGMF
ncbi:MAG: DUF3592 domain-containing protein [Planctomycetota bacterium]